MLRKKQSMVIVTFYTTAEAMEMEQLCRRENINGSLFSAPRELSADCGIAWKAPLEEEEHIRAAITAAQLEIHGIHILEV